jgi:hypothetical protein
VSDSLAIAAATGTLRNLLLAQVPVLDADLSDLDVTTQPPDVARKNVTKAQINIFLYQIAFNAAWRNRDMPNQVRPGESAFPPLALNLHYMLTAYGRGDSDNDAINHRVLAAAMSVLHDHALLGADEIRNALPNNDLADQIERVRITPLQFSVDELSKLWTGFQTNYRISTAYEVAVVLIDSRLPTRAPLPVLKRGPQDRGVTAVASAAPVLDSLQLPRGQSAVRLGDDIILNGRQLTPEGTSAFLTSTRVPDPVEVIPTAGDVPATLRLHLKTSTEDASAPARWAPGVYTVAVSVQRIGAPTVSSNELPVALAPVITVSPLAAAAGNITLNVTSMPRIRDGQRVYLLIADRLVSPQSITNPADATKPTALVFQVPSVAAGKYIVRLRVDGADSIPVDFSGPTPEFDIQQRVVVT